MKRLLIATTNPGKIFEVTGALEGLTGWEMISLHDLPPQPEPPETGRTFLENAVAKAVAYSRIAEGMESASGTPRHHDEHLDSLGDSEDTPRHHLASLDHPQGPPSHPLVPSVSPRNRFVASGEYHRRLPGRLTLADDSGLCVEALGGEPGVRSARYGGAGLDDAGRRRFLLERMRDIPEARRGAHFECVLALASAGALVETFTGVVEGRLLFEERGAGGFGYDPVFFYPPAGRTFAEMTRDEKSAVSHRGRALAALCRYLEEQVELRR